MANPQSNIATHKRNLPRLICFTGSDGSGKTTLARALTEKGKQVGIDYHYVWANAQPILLCPLRWISNRTLLRRQDMFRDYQSYKSVKLNIVRRNRLVRWIYVSVLILDYVLWVIIRMVLPMMFGRRIILDRYVYDVAINVGLLLEQPVEVIGNWIEAILCVFPKPGRLFWVDVPEEVAWTRKDDIPSMAYLQERRQVYKEIMRRCGPITIDGTQPVEDLLKYVWDYIRG